MLIYNTYTRQKEEFKPIEENKVKMYICGPTVYNYVHIGNARPVLFFDLVHRYFNYLGYEVDYVSNVTDVDDKIINRAIEEEVTEAEIAKKYLEYFLECNQLLNALPFNKMPKVTENMEEMIDFIHALVERGYAYAVEGDVYFRIDKVREYGQLSGKRIEELEVGARIAEDSKKENPLDFVLWKKTDKGITWDSPWGAGRPGWHTECVVMINDIFDDGRIDIHGGGQDLKFPHHENEIAQSMACHHHPIANVWMHNQMINIDNQKMSKSLGNVLWAKDLIETLGCNVFKWLMLSTHYRNPLNFTEEVLTSVKKEVEKVENVLKQTSLYLQVQHYQQEEYSKETVDTMVEALSDDLNTSLALTQILNQVKVLNQSMRVKDKDNQVISREYQTLIQMLDVMGFVHEMKQLSDNDIVLYEKWLEEKANKNFDKADELRGQLQMRGII